MRCKIPINPSLFGDFNRGKRLKIATIYFWLRSMSMFDGKEEFVDFPARRPYSVRFISEKFGYGRNQVSGMMDVLVRNGLIVVDNEHGRYICRTDFNNGECIFLDQRILSFFIDTYQNSDIILVLGYLKAKYSVYGSRYKFTFQDINDYLGYQAITKSTTGEECIDTLVEEGYIKYNTCNGDSTAFLYQQYKQLTYVRDLENVSDLFSEDGVYSVF